MFEIETKHLFALIVLVAFGSATFFATLIWQRMRDLALFFLVFGAVLIERMDVTFLGQYWYRGTARGIEISAVDVMPLCLLAVTLLMPRYRHGRFYWPASLTMLLVYFVYCCVSVANAEPQIYGVWELTKMFRGLLVFLAAALFIRTRRELAIVVAALGCVAWMEAINAVEQRYFKGAFRPPGTLDHENTLSTYLCTIGPVLLAATMSNWSKWLRWFAGLSCLFALGAELLTLSRMGVPVFALTMTLTAIFCTSWKLTKRKIAIVLATAACAGVLVFASWNGLKARFTTSSIESEFLDQNRVETRGMYWRLAFAIIDEHPYGIGLGNWSYYVSKKYGPELGWPYTDYDDIKWTPDKEEAKDIFLAPSADTLPALTIGELGIAGLVVFLLIWLRWFQLGLTFLKGRLNDDPMHRLGIGLLFSTLGIFFQSATEWTYRQPAVMFTFHVLMGMLAAIYYARRHPVTALASAPAEATAEVEVETMPLSVARVAK